MSRGVAVVIKGGDRGGSDAMGSCVYGASPVAARQPIVLSGPICGAAYFLCVSRGSRGSRVRQRPIFTRQPRQPTFSKENFLSFKVFFFKSGG